jgi:putative transposase
MKRSRFSEEQIPGILKEHEADVSVADLRRRHGQRWQHLHLLTLLPWQEDGRFL